MINSFKQKDGRVGVILWGVLTKAPQYKETKNGDKMCWFFVRYGFEPTRNPNDRPTSKSIKVLCFKDAADHCDGLEAWEPVLICGELKENEYNGSKEFNVVADIVLAPNAQIAAVTALNEVRNLQNGVPSSSKETPSQDGGMSSYEDIDQSVIDDIFPGL